MSSQKVQFSEEKEKPPHPIDHEEEEEEEEEGSGLKEQSLSTLDLGILSPLTPEVISRQATINVGTIGHVAHGKSTVVRAISGVKTVSIYTLLLLFHHHLTFFSLDLRPFSRFGSKMSLCVTLQSSLGMQTQRSIDQTAMLLTTMRLRALVFQMNMSCLTVQGDE